MNPTRFNFFRFASIFLVLGVYLPACKEKIEQTRPKIAPVTESVYASARIKAEDQYTVFSFQSGTLKEVLVEAGDTVTADQPLFRLDDKAQGLNSENARLALELSEENARTGSARNRELETALRLANEKLALDSDLLKRQKALWAQGVGTKADLDQRQLAVDNSRSNVISAKSRLDQAVSQLKNEVARARNTYQISQKQRSDYLIRSVQPGRVFDVLKKKGELVNPQTPLAVVGNPDRFLVELEVDQADITRIKPGQPVSVIMDSYKGQVFEAAIAKIHPIMDEKTRTFTVEALFSKAPPALYPNLTAEANVLISTKQHALTIPRNYLVDGKYVWVGKDEKRHVIIGLQDDQKVEILSGIDSSTVIYKP